MADLFQLGIRRMGARGRRAGVLALAARPGPPGVRRPPGRLLRDCEEHVHLLEGAEQQVPRRAQAAPQRVRELKHDFEDLRGVNTGREMGGGGCGLGVLNPIAKLREDCGKCGEIAMP